MPAAPANPAKTAGRPEDVSSAPAEEGARSAKAPSSAAPPKQRRRPQPSALIVGSPPHALEADPRSSTGEGFDAAGSESWSAPFWHRAQDTLPPPVGVGRWCRWRSSDTSLVRKRGTPGGSERGPVQGPS